MSRWGKNIVVPLDSLCKEKENTNRPTVARSVGTVGKWGKMGFTSTRTYSLSALPPAVAAAAAAAAAAASPAQSPVSPLDDDLSPSVPEPPKPKKFFKSRNTAPPEVIAQIIQQFPRLSTSPMRDTSGFSSTLNTPVHEPIKLKIAKGGNSAERKKKTPKKKVSSSTVTSTSVSSTGSTPGASKENEMKSALPAEAKVKKKKEEKKLKPEAPPSRIISRARKTVNYCEDDDEDRMPTPIKDIILPKTKTDSSADNATKPAQTIEASPAETPTVVTSPRDVAVLPPPMLPSSSVIVTPKTPEHPPIVLRISKGTSRLVSTDSEEPPNASPAQQHHQQHPPDLDIASTKLRHTVISEDNNEGEYPSTPKIIVKPLKPPTTALLESEPASHAQTNNDENDADKEDEDNDEDEEEETPEINYCTVKISPDKPPKERLKLIIKTDVIRNAIAKAAAAAAAKAAKQAAAAAALAAGTAIGNAAISSDEQQQKQRNEKKTKSKKHKHPKHSALEPLLPTSTTTSTTTATTTVTTTATAAEFKTPSPHLALSEHPNMVISPTTRSDHEFDSQSSVLGSISSKGNSTPQLLAQTVQEESCVIRSRGSSVITSDLETSQHSSLVAPPSDIESRLESMMMTVDGGFNVDINQRGPSTTLDEPLQDEDILAVLRGDEDVQLHAESQLEHLKVNGKAFDFDAALEESDDVAATKQKRVTRGRGRKANNEVQSFDESPPPTLRTRGRGKAAANAVASVKSPSKEVTTTTTAASSTTTKRSSRRVAKKASDIPLETPMDVDPTVTTTTTDELAAANESKEENISAEYLDSSAQLATSTSTTTTSRRGRNATRSNNNISNNNNNNLSNSNINNNNINKIAANLSAKAEASKLASLSGSSVARSYGRKRKNQQVTQVLQQTSDQLDEELPTPAKVTHRDMDSAATSSSATAPSPPPSSLELLHDEHSNNSNSSSVTNMQQRDGSSTSPPRRDYKFKDKFKRTLTLDSQVGSSGANNQAATDMSEEPEPHQRGAVKLVISKKKGSIFKSRALVPSDQAEQGSVAKRHLYKHRWDATLEGNGAGNDGSNGSNTSPSSNANNAVSSSKSNDNQSSGKTIDDFGDSPTGNISSTSAAARGDSPAFGKLTRVIKLNPQAISSSITAALSSNSSSSHTNNPFDLDDEEMLSSGPSGGLASGDCITSVRVDRKAKEYYTVVRNVKTAHQIQEIGEYQEMDDDVEYILDALQPQNPPATRCLSALQLATKCMTPAFRMHVRAHGVVTKFFKALSDANKDLSLGLCTSAIMYILSQEGLNMDLDCDSLELMMNLLEAEGVAAPSDRANYDRNKQKVRELCEEIKAQGKATHLNVDSITVGTLAMETLLSLTSKRAGEWFKEDLRKLGGLEHIIKTISDCCRPVFECSSNASTNNIEWTQALLDNMQTVARCLRVLENVTQLNEENVKYMLTYANGAAVNTLCTLYRLCDSQMSLHPTTELDNHKEHPGVAMRDLLIPVMKVLINLTHNTYNSSAQQSSTLGATMLGKRSDIIETSFNLLLLAPNYIPDRCVFELSILVLLLLINLTMYTVPNRAIIMKAFAPLEYQSEKEQNRTEVKVSAIQAILEYFYRCEELARLVEKNTDAILDNTEKTKKKQEEVDETVNNLLQKAGHHMEHTLKGSYAGILIGHLITDSEEYETIVRAQLRDNGFKEIISVLEKYHTFMNLTASSEASVVAHIKSTKKLIDYFKKRDLLHEMNNSNDSALPLNLEMTNHPHHHQNHNTTNLTVEASTSSSNSNSNTATTSSSLSRQQQLSTTSSTKHINAASRSPASHSHDSSDSSSSSPPSSPTQTVTRSAPPRVYKTYSQR